MDTHFLSAQVIDPQSFTYVKLHLTFSKDKMLILVTMQEIITAGHYQNLYPNPCKHVRIIKFCNFYQGLAWILYNV